MEDSCNQIITQVVLVNAIKGIKARVARLGLAAVSLFVWLARQNVIM